MCYYIGPRILFKTEKYGAAMDPGITNQGPRILFKTEKYGAAMDPGITNQCSKQ